MNNLNECCGAYPTVYMPMWWGNKQIDESLTPHVECRKCGRVCHGKTPDQAYDNWNSTNEKTPKDAYKEFDKQTKRELEEAEIRNCPVRGPILKKMDEAIRKSRKELCDWLMSDKKPTVGVPNIDMRSKHDFVISSDDRMMKEFENSPLLNDKLTDLQVYRCFSDKPSLEFSEPTMTEVIMPDGEKQTVGMVMCHEKPKHRTLFGLKMNTGEAMREFAKAVDNLNKQKETKMIDLSECNVNDEFLTGRGLVMTVVYIGFNSIVMKDKDCNLNVYDMDTGSVLTFKIGPQYDIASKHKSVTSGEKFRVLCEMFPLLVREMAKTSGYSIDQLRELIVDGKYIINDKCELSLAL